QRHSAAHRAFRGQPRVTYTTARARPADRARARGADADGPWPLERRARDRPLREREDREDPREQHPEQARGARPGPGGDPRLRVGRRGPGPRLTFRRAPDGSMLAGWTSAISTTAGSACESS